MPFMPPRDKTVLIIHETQKMVDFPAFAMQISRTRLEPVEALAIEAATQLLNWFQMDELSNDKIPALDWPNF